MTLLLLTSDALLAERIGAGLAEHCPFVRVIGHCYTAEAGMEATLTLRPEAVLLDLDMPGVRKKNLLTTLSNSGCRVIGLTAHEALYRKMRRQSIAVLLSTPWEPAALAVLLTPQT